MAQKILVIMSGISGSGKSFLADLMHHHYEEQGLNSAICSTDHYWYCMVGSDPTKYDFNPSLIGEAHKWNQERVKKFLNPASVVEVVIVDNTNLKNWEIKPYVDMAKEHGAEVRIVSVTVPLDVAKKGNDSRSGDRKVPEEVIERQHKGRETLILE